jgi:hypothetical protein
VNQTTIIPIDWAGSLYDPASDEFLTQIEEALLTASPGGVVILRAKDACHDYHRGWLHGLNSHLYWEDIAAHFQRVHLALVGICLSKSRWFFISGHDCLGSWWDLALACHGRVWANPYSKVGFPEVYIDMIPPLASGGLRKFAPYHTVDDARKNAILHAKDAYAKGVVSLVLQGQEWAGDDGLEALYAWIRKSAIFVNLRSTTKKELMEVTPDILGVVENRSNHQLRRRQIAASHLEAGYALLKEKNIAARALAMSTIRAGGAGRVLFDDYQSWLSRRISRYEIGARDRWWSSSDGLLVVDLASGVPPQALFQILLSRKIHLVLTAPTESILKDALETVISRSQRGGVTRKDILATWRGRVDWVIGEVSQCNRMWLSCPGTDVIELGVGQSLVVKGYRLSGNYGQAGPGWVEIMEDHSASPSNENCESVTAVRDVFDMLSNGAVRKDNWAVSIPVAAALRFVLLSEMIRLADSGRWPDLVEQCKLLAAAGWGFASDVPQWDALLRWYAKAEPLTKVADIFGRDDFGDLSGASMAELRVRTTKPGNVARLEISGARLSRHYEAFATTVVDLLLAAGIVETAAMADLFVSLAWGCPGASPLPSVLSAALGPSRVAQWLDEQLYSADV